MHKHRYKTITFIAVLCLFSILVPAQQSKETFLYPVQKEGKWGFIDQTGAIVIAPQFDSYSDFQDGLARMTQNDRVVFIDRAGKIVLKPDFQIVEDFSEGLAPVNNGEKRNRHIGLILETGRWGYIDKTGQLALPMKFTHAEAFREGLAAVELDKRKGFIDRAGKLLFELPFDVTMEFHEGVVAALLRGNLAYYDRNGKKLDTPPLDPGPSYHSFSEGLATIETNGKSGYINQAGKLVIPAEFLDAEDFSEGLAAVQVGGEMRWCPEENGSRRGSPKRFGYIDKAGKMTITPQFEYAGPFREGLANVCICSKWGFIDRKGQVVIPLQFDGAIAFRGGLARVTTTIDRAVRYIDKTGKIVWPPAK